MNTDHVMVDLETADKTPTSAIVAIGAVVFQGPSAGVGFYQAVDLHSSKALGLTESAETMAWWAGQSEQARSVFTDPNRKPIIPALVDFATFMLALSDPKLWGNGSDFDNAILQVAYRLGRFPGVPWDFWNNRCYRTAMAGVRAHGRTGVHHNALDDASTQASRLLKYRPEMVR